MDEATLQEALEHDRAQKREEQAKADPLHIAAACIESAEVACRGSVAGLLFCKPPALPETRKAVQMAISALEQALVLMSLEEPFSV
jgi:hypothetical protein